ncbi:MAG: MBL fold metallo-hydrolase, partial [Cyanobacteria bacterium REEB65]|nr:MBL fold metallo-hydrolase [Cyanobacteria bacterium REEB65]
LHWLGGFDRPPARTFIVHGEPEAALALAAKVREQLSWQVEIPAMGDIASLQAEKTLLVAGARRG